jgi:Predicted transcriptional regulator containing CBS domains
MTTVGIGACVCLTKPDQAHMTKHELLLRYIKELEAGEKISVRRMAKEMGVSEGTAYRAIKEAELLGYVSTKERIGTVRVGRMRRDGMDTLKFMEVVDMVDGHVLGGESGLDKTLHKFVIGAMEIDAMMKYIDAGSLLIVGNRPKAHTCALQKGAGILITGGFDTTDEVKELADRLGWPIISSRYDTFTVASMINRAIDDRQIKNKILLVEDLVSGAEPPVTLRPASRVSDWNRLVKETGHSRVPVVDEWNRIVGIVTSKDIVGAPSDQTIDKLMTREPRTVLPHTSLASAAHMMVWEGIELLPVVDHSRRCVAVISRQDVLKAMQYVRRQPQTGETFEDLIWSAFKEEKDEQGAIRFRGAVMPQMTNHLGTASEGVLATLVTKAAYRVIKMHKKGDLILDNLSTYFIRPLQIDSEIVIAPKIIELSRRFAKVEVDITHGGHLAGKAMLAAKLIEQM